jgi:hypothetical protein
MAKVEWMSIIKISLVVCMPIWIITLIPFQPWLEVPEYVLVFISIVLLPSFLMNLPFATFHSINPLSLITCNILFYFVLTIAAVYTMKRRKRDAKQVVNINNQIE